MPEGPEVETIRRGLESVLAGQTVSGVDIIFSKSFEVGSERLPVDVIGATVGTIDRRGKVLMVQLSSDYVLMFHLKMTGQVVVVQASGNRIVGGHPNQSMGGKLPDNSTRVVFAFASGDIMYFNDQRKFGWIKLMPKKEVAQDALVGRLGPEVLSDQFSVDYLAGELRRHARAVVKAVLLDQTTVAGIGNIYADESLHLAGIHPARLAGSLRKIEIERLWASSREVIALAIERGGTSFSHFVNPLGVKGDYLSIARVFNKAGQPCPRCGTAIAKLRVAGRGTHVCLNCQRLRP